MKVFQSSIFRALCAIVVGALLVEYGEQTVTWITIAIGVMFLVSGVISCIAYFSAKRSSSDIDIYDAQGNKITHSAPPFPIVGVGSIILGAILALMPNTFVNGLMYVLAAILILGALNQFFNLASSAKYAAIGIVWWIFPIIIFLVGLLALVKPSMMAAAPLIIIGWCMIVYGTVDLINAIKIHQCRKRFVKAEEAAASADEVTSKAEAGQEG